MPFQVQYGITQSLPLLCLKYLSPDFYEQRIVYVCRTKLFVIKNCPTRYLQTRDGEPIHYRVVRWPVFHRPGRYFTANLAEAGEKTVFWKSVPEAGILKINNFPLL